MGEFDWMYKMGVGKLKFVKKDIQKKIRRLENVIIRLTNQIEEIDGIVRTKENLKKRKIRNKNNPKHNGYRG